MTAEELRALVHESPDERLLGDLTQAWITDAVMDQAFDSLDPISQQRLNMVIGVPRSHWASISFPRYDSGMTKPSDAGAAAALYTTLNRLRDILKDLKRHLPHANPYRKVKTTTKFEEFVILELFGHRKLAGKMTEVEIAGAGFLRLDIPGKDGKTIASQHYSPAAVYGFTPVTEEIARLFAVDHQPEPVARWELPTQPPTITVGRWQDCHYALSCARGIMCHDCDVYIENGPTLEDPS